MTDTEVADEPLDATPTVRRPPWQRVVAIVVVIAVVASLGAAVILALSDDRSSSIAGWDDRVAPIARFVEQERGLRFRRPVDVDFLPPAAFQKRMRTRQALTAKERRQLDQTVDALRALGLLHGKVDLQAIVDQVLEQGVIGFYEPKTKHVYVRGATLDVYGRVTLAHELTHALQDQHVDLGVLERLENTPAQVARTVVEGDAVLVQQAYVASLPAADQARYLVAARNDLQRSDLSGVPDVLLHGFAFPYVFGPAFVEALDQARGSKAINRAIADPPRSEAEIISPDRYLSRVSVVRVARPTLAAGERSISTPGEIGQASLLEVFGSVAGYADAWRAVKGWRGDQWILYERGGTTCVAIAARLHDQGSLDAFGTVARRWAQTIPGATVTTEGLVAEVRSCDPGPDGLAPPRQPTSVWDVLQLRAGLIQATLRSRDVTAVVAACMANHVIETIGPDALGGSGSGEPPRALLSRLPEVMIQADTACAGTKPGTIGI